MSIALPDFVVRRLVGLVGTRLPRAAAPFYPDVLWRVDSSMKEIYLTFDDGPNAACTGRILDVLDRYEARATFYLLGANAEQRSDLVRVIQSAGHGIGNHSFSHPDPWKTTTTDMLKEFDRTWRLLEDLTGEPIRSLRPPYGRFTYLMRKWCRRRDYRLTMWDVGPGDYLEAMSADSVVRELRAHVRPGSIVVLHDNPRCSTKTPAALERFLRLFTDEGWSFPALPA